MRPTPTRVKLDVAGNQLTIEWDDDSTSTYDGGYLRFICPCAGCRGHAPGEVQEPLWGQCRDVRVSHVSGVGTYALGFTLSDGHNSGIYSYDVLWKKRPETVDGVDARGRPID